MAQTKRKRRSKHRGTAAGTVESRGRTGRKPTPTKKSGAAGRREERLFREPSWKGAAIRAALAAIMLFILFEFLSLGPEQSVLTSIALSLTAFTLYVPLGYVTDRAVWKRRMRKAGRALPESKPRR